MPELIAEGPDPRQRWRMDLVSGEPEILGRDVAADLPVPWDPLVSRRHATLLFEGGRLQVRRLSPAINPLYFAGQAVESCELHLGEHFVIGGTRFVFSDTGSALVPPSAQPVEEVSFNRQSLELVQYRDPDRRIEVLSHLPDVIWGARTDDELYLRLANLLLAGISSAEAVAIVSVAPDQTVQILHGDRRRETSGAVRPSGRLVLAAVIHRQQSVLHVWESEGQPADFTATQEFDWAFCTPVHGPSGERWALYLAGRFEKPPGSGGAASPPSVGGQLQADVKFAELVAEIVSSVRKLRHLERRQAGLRQFFPPVILSALDDDIDTALLAPRELDVTVLFCDLRGFSKRAEGSRDDLIGFLDRVSQALGVMTHQILEHNGVIGDFQGDAAMGFWGWPVADADAPLHACRAALGIRRAFAEAGRVHPGLAEFEVGIGMAHGKAIAGKIGTPDHVKVTVFGPVVNLASRFEGMTRHLRVPIIIDETLAEIVRHRLPPAEGRTRHLARILPFGMEVPLMASELLPGEDEKPELKAEHLVAYERAVAHFTAGRWDEAYRALRDIPAGDRAQDFLMLQIAQHDRIPPHDWTGVVRLPTK